ncbi:ABC transporter ATP-binding protein/permease [Streptomyces poriferorum]|uniref:ATP-binding cassette domain-containing protein n=1 Tax=Streptomyces poriferorum TaxID=2798799 RepID=A0ABY9IYQ9_9ACTN|nr:MULTISPECIES: ABC transporter ATP-binding protein/permease [Streptomyces]MDP5310173.1 ATP-binding cassette domain-containing protein [Streptomyces sp. Alt4]WLQ60663.1 ATP-binding cassette domain-containing protein [Streptomyces sp. Alt2]
MPSLLGAATEFRSVELGASPRSVTPGRQRWDVKLVLGRPRTAEILAAALRHIPGITEAQANPVTGGVLVRHDARLRATDIGRIIRRAVTRVAEEPAGAGRPAPARPAPASAPRADLGPVVRPVLAVGGGVAAGVALIKGSTLSRQLVAAGGVATATAVVLRKAWRGTVDTSRDATGTGAERHPLLEIVGPHRRRLYRAAALSVACQTAEMALGTFLGWTGLVLIKGEAAPLVSLGLTTASAQLWGLAGLVAVACAAVAGLSYASNLQWRRLGQDIEHDWRSRTYRHVQHLELGHLEGERTSKVAGALTNDVGQLGAFFAGPANDVLQLGTSLAVLVPAFLLLAPQIAWIAFLPVPVIAWLSLHHQKKAAADYAATGECRSKLGSQVINSLEAGATVKSFCTEDYEAERIDVLSESVQESSRQTDRSTIRHAETVRSCTTASMAATLLIGGLSVLNGTLRFEVFSPLIGLPQMLLMRMSRVGGITDQYQRTLASYNRVQRLRTLPVEADGGDGTLDLAEVRGEVVLDGVTFAYPGRPTALKDLSLTIPAGQVTALVGATGSGKTTIARLLMRFQDAQSGRVLIDGQDIRDLRRHSLRHAIGFVAQDPFLFDGSIADNIRYGSFAASDEEVLRAAAMAEAHTFVATLPDGYDTLIGERGAALSGGQRQRIALARAILKDSPVVILDEATSAVDNETEAAIQRTLRGFATDRTMVVIAHRLSTVRHADRIYVMDKGGIVAEQGTHDELLAQHGLYASLWQLQAGELAA